MPACDCSFDISVLHELLDLPNFEAVMLWAACSLQHFGFLRAGESTKASPFDPWVHLTPADLQGNSSANPQSLRAFVKCWKTERLFNVFRPWLCSTSSCDWVVQLPSPEGTWCWISISLSRWPPSYLVLVIVISAIHPSGVPGKFSDHSFKIGAATTVAQESFPDHLIKMLGHWSSNAYQLYVRTPVETILSVAVMLSY